MYLSYLAEAELILLNYFTDSDPTFDYRTLAFGYGDEDNPNHASSSSNRTPPLSNSVWSQDPSVSST